MICTDETLETLGYGGIRRALAACCLSEAGARAALESVPSDDAGEIDRLQRLTGEAYAILFERAEQPVRSFESVAAFAEKVQKGGTLEIAQLNRVSALLGAARAVRDRLLSYDDDAIAELPRLAVRVQQADELAHELSRCILSDDELADDASEGLAAARREIRLSQRRIKDKLNGMLRSQSFCAHLRDRLVTMRDGRYVFPVRTEERSSVPGLVHDVSDSGATSYVEPMAIVESNNRLRAAVAAEQEEVSRVLYDLSRAVAARLDVLENNERYLTLFDLIFARARLAAQQHAVRPQSVPVGTLVLTAARHPAIAADKVVPTSLTLSGDKRVLLVSGPNTGGKTVVLKTVGLFCLMAYSGLFLPCAEARLPVFSAIRCDIGDNQSIEQSVSTFGSHVKAVAEVLDAADESSLVLLDELGAGTDPAEGAALAVAVVRDLAARNVTTVVTTHFSELKEFGLLADNVQNASMEFDPETLAPTYRLRMGLPGVSNALEIASRLGLKREVVAYATAYLGEGKRTFEEVLGRADKARIAADAEREQLQREREELRAEREALAEERRKVDERYRRLTERAQAEIDRIAERSRERAEEILAEMEALAKADAAENLLRAKQLRTSLSSLGEAPADTESYEPIDPKTLAVGDTVIVRSVGSTAKVRSLPDRRGRLDVAVGNMVMSVSLDALARRRFEQPPKPAPAAPRVAHAVTAADAPVSTQIDLLGRTVDEAIVAVDALIDNAFLHGITQLRIIHGIGTGALRKGLWEHFRRHRNIAEFRAGQYGEGGYGVTILTLK